MVDIDDTDSKMPACPVVDIRLAAKNQTRYVYRLSWIIEGKRKERFYDSKNHAEMAKVMLIEAADIVGITIEALIGAIEVQSDR